MKLKQLGALFLSFAKVGIMTFGGGYAMLPMFRREISEKRGWATEEEMGDCYALSQCTPGPIAVNSATYIGYKVCGVAGGICATLGVVFPSLVIILLIAAFLSNFAELPLVKNAFAGVRVVVCVLIFNTVVSMGKKTLRDRAARIIFLAVFVLAVLTDISPVLFILAAAAAGVVIKNLGVKR